MTAGARRWRLLDTGRRSAAENMALDEVLLTLRARGAIPDTVRFLQFERPAVLVGFHQAVEQEVRLDHCRRYGIEVNRRLTGGGAIYFDESQVGWEVVAGRDDPLFRRPPEELYRLLAEGAVRGLARLGVKAAFRPYNDVEVEGRKISGTGGTEREGAFLFQGTLLVDFDVEGMLKALRLPAEKLKDKEIVSFRERVTCLAELLGRVPPAEAVKEALAAGLAEVLEVELCPGSLTAGEEALLGELAPRFAGPEWVERVRRPPEEQGFVRVAHKAPGGIIRVVARVDRRYRRLKQVFLTGDFFAYPQRLVLDLEAWLKDAPAQEEELRRRIHRFFAGRDWAMPGVTPEDFVQALAEVCRRLEYHELGIPAEEVNRVFTVVRPLGELEGAAALLLPYCAKPNWCELRHEDACAECGGCTVGEAYRLARERGMRAVTITRYEHLEETLARLRDEGVRAFVGCCCEPFYAKHQRDFERIGLAGALVDIDDVTCYDLGEEGEAHRGRFEKETTLRLDLLERVLDRVAPPPACAAAGRPGVGEAVTVRAGGGGGAAAPGAGGVRAAAGEGRR